MQNQYCQEQGGEEHLTLWTPSPPRFKDGCLELVADHDAGLGDIPAGAKTYRLYADFDAVPANDLRMMGLWGDEQAPWFIEAPGGLYVSAFSGAGEDALPSQALINPLFFGVLPEAEFSSFWTVGEMWAGPATAGNALHPHAGFLQARGLPLRQATGRLQAPAAQACWRWRHPFGTTAWWWTACI